MSTKWHKAFNVIGAFKPGNTDEESYSSEEEIAQVRGGTEKRRRHKPLPATPPHRSSTSTSLNQGNYQPTPRPRFQPGYPSDPGFYDGQQTTGIYAPTQYSPPPNPSYSPPQSHQYSPPPPFQRPSELTHTNASNSHTWPVQSSALSEQSHTVAQSQGYQSSNPYAPSWPEQQTGGYRQQSQSTSGQRCQEGLGINSSYEQSVGYQMTTNTQAASRCTHGVPHDTYCRSCPWGQRL